MNWRSAMLAVSTLVFISEPSRASFVDDHFGLKLSAGAALGQLGSSDADLDRRWMNSLSADGLLGYRHGRFTVGLHGNYRLAGQISSVESSNNTNLTGREVGGGVGAAYQMNDELYALLALDFLGGYRFDQPTEDGQDDELKRPLALRAKLGYFFSDRLPLSIDGDFQYTRFNELHVSGRDTGWSANQVFVGVALTYHFGGRYQPSRATPHVESTAVTPLEPAVDTPIATLDGNTGFAANSSDLSDDSKRRLDAIAQRLIEAKNLRVTIAGYTDTSGRALKNVALSKARADAVKDYFISRGVAAERIQADGFGSAKPIASNDTPEGRSKNRRVEIQLESPTSEAP